MSILLILLILFTTAGCRKEPDSILGKASSEEVVGEYVPLLLKEGIFYNKGKVLKENEVIIEFFNGFTYVGDSPKENEIYKGKIFELEELIYEGEFKNHTPNGQGKLYIERDIYYEGEFLDGIGVGKGNGRLITCNGSIYEGELLDNKPNGFGKITIEDGSEYYGYWLKGYFYDGLYNVYDKDNDINVVGDFRDNGYFATNAMFSDYNFLDLNESFDYFYYDYIPMMERLISHENITEKDINDYIKEVYGDIFISTTSKIVGLPFEFREELSSYKNEIGIENEDKLIKTIEDKELRKFIKLLTYSGEFGLDYIVSGDNNYSLNDFLNAYYFSLTNIHGDLINTTTYSDKEAFLDYTFKSLNNQDIPKLDTPGGGVHLKDIEDLMYYFFDIKGFMPEIEGLEEINNDRFIFDTTGFNRTAYLTDIEEIKKNKEYKLIFNIRNNAGAPHDLLPIFHSQYHINIVKENDRCKIKGGELKHHYKLEQIVDFNKIIYVDIELDNIRFPNVSIDLELMLKKIDSLYSDLNKKNLNYDTKELVYNLEEFIESVNNINYNLKDSKITIDSKLIDDKYDDFKLVDKYLKGIITKYTDLQINKDIENNLLINIIGNNNPEEVFKITISDSIEPYLGVIDNIKINLQNNSVKINNKTLKNHFEENESLMVSITNNDDGVELYITNKLGDVVKLRDNISLGIYTESKSSNIYYNDENLGGTYNNENSMMYFDTKVSGKYELNIVPEDRKAKDVDDLDVEAKRAIEYLDKKDILLIKDEKFRPNEILTRYEFTKAIVKILYELDMGLETSFNDVERDNPYYEYIASSEDKGIVKGYPDNTFKGDKDIPREEFISICSRALNRNNKYSYPNNIEELLAFKDSNKITDYAKKEVALAISNGLISVEDKFDPQAKITREEAAVILYRLVDMLYDLK